MTKSLPPPPKPSDYLFIARIRQALCLAAFAVAAALPVAWAMSTADFAQQHRRFLAEATLALALFGTIGMMLGWGYGENWNRFRIGSNAAGYGLVLIPLGVVAVVVARSAGAGDAGDAGDAGGAGGAGPGPSRGSSRRANRSAGTARPRR
jgi:hypothetical protein